MILDNNFSLNSDMVDYALGQLAERFGLENINDRSSFYDQTGSTFFYGSPEEKESSVPGIIVRRCSDDAWGAILSAPSNSLNWMTVERLLPSKASLPFNDSIPVIFWGAGCEGKNVPFVEKSKNSDIIFNADIIAGAFFMLSRWEEMVIPDRDEHGRFPAKASVAFKQGFLNQPIVDRYAKIFQAWIISLNPSIKLNPRKFAVKLSHDIDKIKRKSAPKNNQTSRKYRKIGIKSFKRKILSESNPHLRGILELAKISEEVNLNSAFYFMTAENGDMDRGYHDDRSDELHLIIEKLTERGHEIGFHPGYETFGDREKFLEEKRRMDEVLGHTNFGGRHHYLRFTIPDTWRLWEEAGMIYDSTLGYEMYNGFRCGTCHPYHPFDIKNNRKMKILEVPLVVMEFTLNKFRDYSPQESADRILTLAKRCKEVDGVLAFLWHNTSFTEEWQPYIEQYKKLLPILKEMETE